MQPERPIDLHFGLSRPNGPASGPGSSSRAQGQPDVLAAAEPFVQPCGPHDYGVDTVGCACPTGDYRPVMVRLMEEVKRLRGLLDGAEEELYVTTTSERVGYRVSNLAQAHQLAAIHRRWQAIDGGDAWVESRIVTQRKRVDPPSGGKYTWPATGRGETVDYSGRAA